MNTLRHTTYFVSAITASLLLSSCQLFSSYNQIDKPEASGNWSTKVIPVADEVNVVCAGTYHCEIARIDQTLVISPETHQPIDTNTVVVMPDPDNVALVDNKSIKLVALSGSSVSGLTNYYARVKPVKREVQVNFYPEDNLNYVERFTIIHEFVAGIYQVQAYRMQSDKNANSLLANASPNPLCVDFIQDGNVERRFCKQASIEQEGEFVETGVFDDTEELEIETIFQNEQSV